MLIKAYDHARKRTEQLLPVRSRFCSLPRHKCGKCVAALPPLLLLAFDEGFVLKELRSLKLFNMPSAQMTTLCISFDAVVAVLKAQEALAKADMLSTTYSGTQAMTTLVTTVGAFLT